MQKINFKNLIIKYVLTVLIFATVYALVTYLLLLASLDGIILNVLAVTAAVLSVMAVMKKLGPWIDRRTGE